VLPEKLATPENKKSYSPVPAFSVRVAQVQAGEHIQKSLIFCFCRQASCGLTAFVQIGKILFIEVLVAH